MPLFSRRTLADQTNVKVTGSKPDDVNYLTMHKLQDALGDAVAKVLTEKPADPIAAIAKSLMPTKGPYTFLTIQPTFTVTDWAAAAPIMAEFVERTKTETGCIYYGWSRAGDKLFCREAYVDAAGVLAHLDNVGACVGKLLDGPATLDKIELHGPKEELDKCKAGMDGLGTTYWEVDSGFTGMSKEVSSVRTAQTLCTIQPTFTVADWEAAAPIMAEFVEKTKTEAGCVYYGWTKVGDKLFCREAYVDAAAVLAHLDNVGPCVGKILDGPASLDGIELHGPKDELDKCKAAMDGLGTTYWAVDSGFQNLAM